LIPWIGDGDGKIAEQGVIFFAKIAGHLDQILQGHLCPVVAALDPCQTENGVDISNKTVHILQHIPSILSHVRRFKGMAHKGLKVDLKGCYRGFKLMGKVVDKIMLKPEKPYRALVIDKGQEDSCKDNCDKKGQDQKDHPAL